LFSAAPRLFDRLPEALPENVFVLAAVPQLAVLRKAKLFVSHGGMNSIRESIHFNIPMLLFPLNRKYDQFSNVAKVVFHNLGERIFTKNDATTIREKITKVLNDPSYRINLQQMKSKMEKSCIKLDDIFKTM
jgi:zeaxanthin glucosyltransferase